MMQLTPFLSAVSPCGTSQKEEEEELYLCHVSDVLHYSALVLLWLHTCLLVILLTSKVVQLVWHPM